MDSTPPKIIDSVNDKAYSSLSKAEGTLIILDDMLINIKPIQKPDWFASLAAQRRGRARKVWTATSVCCVHQKDSPMCRDVV